MSALAHELLRVLVAYQKVAQPSDLPPLRCAYRPSYLQQTIMMESCRLVKMALNGKSVVWQSDTHDLQ